VTGNQNNSSVNDFWKWGDPAKSFHLNDYPKFKSFLEERWKRQLKDDFKAPDLRQIISESSFTESDFRKAFPDLKPEQFSNSKENRIKYGFGKSYHDIIRIFTGKIPPLPDFVLFPESEDDAFHILQQASQHKIGVIPFSGGSNVMGAFEISNKTSDVFKTSEASFSGVVNLQRMKKMIAVDEISLTATFETGIFGPELDKILNAKGYLSISSNGMKKGR